MELKSYLRTGRRNTSEFQGNCHTHIERLKDSGAIKNREKIKLKLSGDGTNIGKRINVVNITFTILNEETLAMSEKGKYFLNALRTTENYDTHWLRVY